MSDRRQAPTSSADESNNLDDDALPPAQYLVMDTLAARYRTGENLWTFPTKVLPTLRQLEAKGFINLMHGIVEKTVRASMTDAGRACVISDTYVPPCGDYWASVYAVGTEEELTQVREHIAAVYKLLHDRTGDRHEARMRADRAARVVMAQGNLPNLRQRECGCVEGLPHGSLLVCQFGLR